MSSAALRTRIDNGVVFVEGVLDEIAPPVLAALSRSLKPGPLEADVGGIKRINSLGVRAWIDFMKLLGERAITFRRCSPAFVDQLNTVSDFRGNAHITSFLAPYVCESTGNVFYEELVIGRDIKAGDYKALQGRRCKECPEVLVFDDLPERYLHFLNIV